MSRRLVVPAILLSCLVSTAGAQEERRVIPAYKTDTAPTIDGQINPGEWDAAGPPIVVAPEEGGSAFPEDPFGGPDDLSFQFRVMWAEPWTAYFLFEVTDDIAMEEVPGNPWEQDQIEFFMDGDDLLGSSEVETFQWWDNEEIYGKFGASRWPGVFEGNTGAMSEFIDDLYFDGFGAFAATQVTETGNNADYIVEYAVSLEPMFDHGTFEGTPTEAAEMIVADATVVKFTVCISDDDNFGDGTTGRSHTVCSFRDPPGADWRDTTAFSDLAFLGPFTSTGTPGDYNGDGVVNAADIDLQAAAMQDPNPDLNTFDENQDGQVNDADRLILVKQHANSWLGDSNLDHEFNSGDLVAVFTAGKYDTGETAGWAEGDWNGDMVFGSGDLVAAFTDGGYEVGPPPAAAIPEPTSFALALLGLLGVLDSARRRR